MCGGGGARTGVSLHAVCVCVCVCLQSSLLKVQTGIYNSYMATQILKIYDIYIMDLTFVHMLGNFSFCLSFFSKLRNTISAKPIEYQCDKQ